MRRKAAENDEDSPPMRSAETVEVGNEYSLNLESHRQPRTFVVTGVAGLRTFGDST